MIRSVVFFFYSYGGVNQHAAEPAGGLILRPVPASSRIL